MLKANNHSDTGLAIRVGWLTELHLQARQIGTFQQWLVAPAAWRERIAYLTSPAAITPSLPAGDG
ncbi:hypothetical protein [Dickeya dianthicola]|uniref:hypothetical protein n=1 Tax=Dickeya dianthicola TaxID=204039 RepID=UPI0030194D9E